MKSLTLAEFAAKNNARCEAGFFPLDSVSPTDLGCALSGEIGEANNLIYKLHVRNKPIDLDRIAEELADSLTYLDLLASRLGIDLEAALIKKFNQVSDEQGTEIKL